MSEKEKKELMKKAKSFCGQNDAFIHSEMKNGDTQQVVCGNPFGIIHACYVALHRTSELTGMDLNDIINMLVDEYEQFDKVVFTRITDLDFPNSLE